MFSYQPSYYTTSPYGSYSEQPDPFRRAAMIQRQREIEAARLEQARREQARLAEARRIQQLQQLRQQQEEARLREAYAQRLRNQRRPQYYAEPTEEEEEEAYQHPFFPFGFAPRQRQPRRSPTEWSSRREQASQEVSRESDPSLSSQEADAPEHQERQPSPISIPISSPSQTRTEEKVSSSQTIDDAHATKQLCERRDAAATTIQTFWRGYALRRKALAQISAIRDSFQSLQSSFTFPSSVEFNESPASSSTSHSIPPLAYSANNRPILGYEHTATQLLTQLDAVDSAGDASIRAARKALVNEVEDALKGLEEKKAEAWRALHTPIETTITPPSPASHQDLHIDTDPISEVAVPVTSETPSGSADEDISSDSEEEAEVVAVEAAISEPEDIVIVEDKDADEDEDDDEAWVDARDEILEDEKDAQIIDMQLDDRSL